MRSDLSEHDSTSLRIQYLAVSKLKSDPKNARVHPKRQLAQIAKSIERFGFNVPVLVNKDLSILAGHGRVQACQLIGVTEVPIIRIEHLSPEQARAFLIADNRLSENATWDEDLLGRELKELSELDLDFELDATGFAVAEIDLLIENVESPPEDVADELPETSDVAVSRSGDLWLLGKHRVLCGNALAPADFRTLMGTERAAMIFTDPPYNIPIAGNVSGKGTIKHEDFAMACGELSPEQFIEFLTSSLRLSVNNSNVGAIAIIAMDWRHMKELVVAGLTVFSELKNLCVWVKDRAGMGTFYRSQHELFFIFKHGIGAHVNNFELGQFGRYRTNVWEYPAAASFAKSGNEGNLLRDHPTVKPVALVADALKDCSKRGDIILDPFLGSGTTVIAAEKTGRICCGIEIDRQYVDLIVRRWQSFTRREATHAISRRLFNDVQKEAANGVR